MTAAPEEQVQFNVNSALGFAGQAYAECGGHKMLRSSTGENNQLHAEHRALCIELYALELSFSLLYLPL